MKYGVLVSVLNILFLQNSYFLWGIVFCFLIKDTEDNDKEEKVDDTNQEDNIPVGFFNRYVLVTSF